MRNKFTPEMITSLEDNEVFVFGSNKEGMHIGGAAAFAQENFGAVWGKGEGLYGQSYALPTMDDDNPDCVKPYVDRFIKFANDHKEFTFLVTPVGCGIAGFTPEMIAPYFKEALDMDNVVLPESFVEVLED